VCVVRVYNKINSMNRMNSLLTLSPLKEAHSGKQADMILFIITESLGDNKAECCKYVKNNLPNHVYMLRT